ncbi:phosphatase PAP2 family protein [Chitinibacter fontanus]|uniref:Phosphatase PAP2 family protein n=1 Tax=Chitinibacter fontanus TaxID=1737446 RepID=A0A7D5V8X8_9NEIS|nr:phosphatase PAP2 family protein [Chitinibacter fontanus]QLI81019.1 phosphatase PAP2 family protein [Chitinibacter fontanus]
MRAHSRRFYLSHFGLTLLFAAILLGWYPQTQWDVAIASFYYDPALHAFPLKNNFFLSGVMHSGLRSALWFIPLALIGVLLWSRVTPELQIHRRRISWLLLGMACATLVVSVLKKMSIHACPWDLQMFGGYAPLLPLFADLPAGISPGRCFPGGHASGGFALFAFYFALRDDAPKLAYLSLVIAVLLGMAMGWTQMMRGAHFLSHNLWTMWWTWMVLLVLYIVFPPLAAKKENLEVPA